MCGKLQNFKKIIVIAPEKCYYYCTSLIGTVEQQRSFLSYVKTISRYSDWYDHFIVFFGTGMRIGKLSALRREDLDFKHNIININFSMERYKGRNDSERCYHMHPPKPSAGKRAIPIQCFRKSKRHKTIGTLT